MTFDEMQLLIENIEISKLPDRYIAIRQDGLAGKDPLAKLFHG